MTSQWILTTSCSCVFTKFAMNLPIKATPSFGSKRKFKLLNAVNTLYIHQCCGRFQPKNASELRKKIKSKSNLHDTRSDTPKPETCGGIPLRGLALGQHSWENTSQRWRAVGDTVSDLTCPYIDLQTSRTVCGVVRLTPTDGAFELKHFKNMRTINLNRKFLNLL